MTFECLEVAHEAVRSIGVVAEWIARRDQALSDQMRRAAVSIVSHIDEGRGAKPQQRTHYYRMALGSAREVTSQLRVAHAWGYVDDVTVALALLDRVRAMLWRLAT